MWLGSLWLTTTESNSSPAVLAAYLPALGIVALLQHANVPWTFGPLRYAIASPAFHAWHHASEERGRDKNFAALFPIWDLAFGTYYLPREQRKFRQIAE